MPQVSAALRQLQQAVFALIIVATITVIISLVQADAQTVCSAVDPHGGKVQECLRSQRPSLSYDCQVQLFRQEEEDSQDLRLSIRLFHKCFNDKIQVQSLLDIRTLLL